MKIKCFFCQKYSINIKKHIKYCKDYRQISEDVFNNCILPLVLLDKYKEKINKNMKKIFTNNIYHLNKNEKRIYNNLNFFYHQIFIEICCGYWRCELSEINYYLCSSFKGSKIENILISTGKKNIKYITIIDSNFSKIGFFHHKYTKNNLKSYGYSIMDINILECLLNSKGIDILFEIATFYNSFKLIKKKLNNIYENI